MQEIFNKLEFRPFSYEDDPEAIADMHCSAETLEGYWFDRAETARMHSKIVVKCPGSDWVLAYNSLIFAHASLVKKNPDEICAISMRIHENYRYPQVARALIEGLKKEAIKREVKAILIFADDPQIDNFLQMLGMTPDRSYQYVSVNAAFDASLPRKLLRNERAVFFHDSISDLHLIPCLGTPYPYTYTLHKALHGADYAVFKHVKPENFDIYINGKNLFACYDGREWHLFKRGEFKLEKEDLPSIFHTLASLHQGQILLSNTVIEAMHASPTNNKIFNDYIIKL